MLSVSRRILVPFVSTAVVGLTLTGCTGRLIPSTSPQTVTLHMQGRLRGGQQPVNGATIQLYDIGQANQFPGVAAPRIGASITSDAGGGFNITGEYTCPAASDQVYLVATGGDSGSGVNSDLVMMTALGNCGDLQPTTFISVNEVTTVATVFAYADDFDTSFSGGANIVGAGTTEFPNFLSLVDLATGAALATNGSAVQLKLNALANSLAVCINSSTTSGGASPACDNLATLAAPQGSGNTTNDSAQIAWLIATNPTYQVSQVYSYGAANPPFQPTLSSAPADWMMNLPH